MRVLIILTIFISSLYSFGSVSKMEYIKKDKGIDTVKVYFEKCVNKNRIKLENKNIDKRLEDNAKELIRIHNLEKT